MAEIQKASASIEVRAEAFLDSPVGKELQHVAETTVPANFKGIDKITSADLQERAVAGTINSLLSNVQAEGVVLSDIQGNVGVAYPHVNVEVDGGSNRLQKSRMASGVMGLVHDSQEADFWQAALRMKGFNWEAARKGFGIKSPREARNRLKDLQNRTPDRVASLTNLLLGKEPETKLPRTPLMRVGRGTTILPAAQYAKVDERLAFKPAKTTVQKVLPTLAVVGLYVALSSCTSGPIEATAPVTSGGSESSPTAESIITPSPEAIIPGSEATEVTSSRQAIIVAGSEQQKQDFFGQIEVAENFREDATPFSIEVDGTSFEFVLIPEGKNEQGEVVVNERMAMKVGPYWELLIKGETQIGDDNYIMWQHVPGWTPTSSPLVDLSPDQLEPVLWYRAKESEIKLLAFAPPTEVASEINFDRNLGVGIEIPYESTPSAFKLALARENGVTLPSEKDMEIAHSELISMEFMGVRINTNIITHKSLIPKITEISIHDGFKNFKGQSAEEGITESVADIFFQCWWKNGPIEHTDEPTDADFQAFMQLWSQAQKGEVPWSELQFTINANDLNDGNGYVPGDVVIWPTMSDIETPEGVRGIKEFGLVYVDPDEVQNITIDPNVDKLGFYGNNLDGNILYEYIGVGDGTNAKTGMGLLSLMARLPFWMSENKVSDYKMLRFSRNSLTTYNDLYWAALQVEPANEPELRNR